MYTDLIQELKKVKGAISYDGDCSVQVLLPTTDNKYLRVGVTDDDVAEKPGIWFDYYEGLNNELNNELNNKIMSKSKIFTSKIYNMNLGDKIEKKNGDFIEELVRVPGGWLFLITVEEILSDGGYGAVSSTFIPYSNEFLNEK